MTALSCKQKKNEIIVTDNKTFYIWCHLSDQCPAGGTEQYREQHGTNCCALWEAQRRKFKIQLYDMHSNCDGC